MNAADEMLKKRAVIDHIVKNKLTREEAEIYMKEQGVMVRIMSFPRAVSQEEAEAGQRFVDRREQDLESE